MADPKTFFQDNLNLLSDAGRDPLAWNLNAGLLALAQKMDRIARDQDDLEQHLRRIEQQVQSLRR